MRRYFNLFVLILFPLFLSSQTFDMRRHKTKDRRPAKSITVDIHGNLQYESKGIKASLSKDIFDNRIYRDNKNNEVSYSDDVWGEAFPGPEGDERRVLLWLVDVFGKTENAKEKYSRNIHGNLEYESKNYSASLSRNVFDDGVYKDNRKNEIKYSKEFWTDVLNDFKGNETQLFFQMIDKYYDKQNYKEEYKVDVFGDCQYKDSNGGKASLSKDVFNVWKYEDSRGNKMEYPEAQWKKILERHGSMSKIFLSLMRDYFR